MISDGRDLSDNNIVQRSRCYEDAEVSRVLGSIAEVSERSRSYPSSNHQ